MQDHFHTNRKVLHGSWSGRHGPSYYGISKPTMQMSLRRWIRSRGGQGALQRHRLGPESHQAHKKVFPLDAPISQSGLFGEAVNSAVEKLQAAKSVLRQFMPRRVREASNPFSSLPRKETTSRSSDLVHPQPLTVWGALGRPFPPRRPCKRLELKRSDRPTASAPSSRMSARGELSSSYEAGPDHSSMSAHL